MRSFALSRAREDNYPGVYQEIVQLIGTDATAKLVEKHGGTSVYVPCTAKPEYALCQLLGEELAQKMIDEFAGCTVEIPRVVALKNEQRNTLILADRAAGMSQVQLAMKYGLTQRYIRMIVNSQPRKERA